MGVWIETTLNVPSYKTAPVTPCVGVWIETLLFKRIAIDVGVTPCVGVWIETGSECWYNVIEISHTLRGCVD